MAPELFRGAGLLTFFDTPIGFGDALMSRLRNEGRDWACFCGLTILFLASSNCRAAELSALAARGYTGIPVPQKVTLGARDFQFGQDWQLELDRSVTPDDVAVVSLKNELFSRYRLSLSGQRRGRAEAGVAHLAVAPGSVSGGEATDPSREALAEQAYKLTLAPDCVNIAANAATGLFLWRTDTRAAPQAAAGRFLVAGRRDHRSAGP